jgi:two-component system, OmpR family, phosphate regulon sensor histidine kinase PhoR
MRSLRGYHFLFGLAVAGLIALGGWWIVLFQHTVELEKKSALNDLMHVSVALALMLGQADSPPLPGPVAGETRLEVIPTSARTADDVFFPLVPRYRGFGVRPRPGLIADLQAKASRRQLQLIGEGSLLVVLIASCVVMLFFLIRSDRRQMRSIEAFISTVTHEMKTPLTGVKSLLQTFAAGKVPREQEEMLYAMGLKEVERLEHMVENVLISGRLRAEHYQVGFERIQIRPLMDAFIEHRRHYLVGRKESIRLVWEPEEADMVLLCDAHALTIVLDNLTDNALKYGGAPAEVRLRVRRCGTMVEIAVEDDGIGFDPARSEELFRPFLRAADTGSGVHHGTGLGLSISRALVRRMGGRLDAESAGMGKGSRFVVTLNEAKGD